MAMIVMKAGGIAVKMRSGCRVTARGERGEPFEPETGARWAELLAASKPSDAFVDVGAYSGFYAIAAGLCSRRAIAIEPSPAAYERLRENILLNGVGQYVMPMLAAASDSRGRRLLSFSPNLALTSAATLEKARPGDISLNIETLAIDMLPLHGRIAAIKIDVERHEPFVLLGAQFRLGHDKPALIVESLDDAAGVAILAAAPRYRLLRVLDRVNLYLEPMDG